MTKLHFLQASRTCTTILNTRALQTSMLTLKTKLKLRVKCSNRHRNESKTSMTTSSSNGSTCQCQVVASLASYGFKKSLLRCTILITNNRTTVTTTTSFLKLTSPVTSNTYKIQVKSSETADVTSKIILNCSLTSKSFKVTY